MRLLTAVPAWEAGVVLPPGEVQVVHRCVDLEDLLVTAATGAAEAVLLSSELPRLDLDALARLRAMGVAVVGVTPPGDEQAERRLRQLGVAHVQPADASPAVIAASLSEALQRAVSVERGLGYAHAKPALAPPAEADPEDRAAGHGRVVAVWGPAGAPGRSTVATGLAGELARQGWPTLLVDADPYGGAVATALGLADEAPGLAAACRRANLGTLDVTSLEELAARVTPTLSVLTGLDRAERWPELRPTALEVVLGLARTTAAVTVVDCGFCLEQDEELSYDTLAPRRNGATLAALDQADLVVVVGTADALGLRRLLLGLAELREVAPEARTTVVLNKVRRSAVPGVEEAREALRRYAGVERVTCVPMDAVGLDAAHAAGLPLAQAVPDAPARRALEQLATSLVGRR